MSDKSEIRVREHTRQVGKPQPASVELPVIAPEKGVKIIDTKQERDNPEERLTRGVKRVGGGDFGKIDKGVKRVHRGS